MDRECKHIQCKCDLHRSEHFCLLQGSLRLYELAIDLFKETIVRMRNIDQWEKRSRASPHVTLPGFAAEAMRLL
jgi:hypothetical protein